MNKNKQKYAVSKKKTGASRLLELVATKKGYIISAVILSSLASVASFIPYIAIFKVVDNIMRAMPDLSSANFDLLIRYGWSAFAGVMLNILLYFGALACSHLAAFGTLYQLKLNFVSHLAKVPLGFHVIIGSGKLRKIMDENIEKVEEFIAHQLPDTVAAFLAPFVMIIILVTVDWRLGLAAMVGVAVAFIMQFHMYGNEGSKKMMQKYTASIEDMNNAAVEYVRGISVVKAFKQTVYSFRRLHDTIKEYTSMVIPYTLSWENSFSAFVTFVNNIYLFVFPVGILIGKNAVNTENFISTFVFYLLFVPAISSTLMKVMYVSSNSMRIITGVEAMDKLLDEPEPMQPVKARINSDFNINFDNVVFSYNKDEETTALNGVSFEARQGEVTAIVGPSGGGKSTIAHLIPRFFDVDKGKICIGGIDVRDMAANYLMENVSFVFQDVFLFKQSVMDNIRMSNPNADLKQAIQAAKAAQCHDFIERLPKGYDTVIGTRGIHLSGGEKQRIAIARAIIKDAPIVVLDESTAFSDPENEHLIQKAFKKLMKNKTVIIIAHRLSTVVSADNIVVVNDGKVQEQGRHDELIKKKGKYYEMWQIYNKASNWKITAKGGFACNE